MPHIELRQKTGTRDSGDVILSVQDRTFDYLMTSPSEEIRISAYLDRDWPEVLPMYAEVFVNEACRFHSKVVKIIAGSRSRTGITLPDAMEEGEQLTIVVARTPVENTDLKTE